MPVPTQPPSTKTVLTQPESGWAKFLMLLGIFNLVAIPAVLVLSGSSVFLIVITAFLGAICCFLGVRLLRPLSNCRNSLKSIADTFPN